MTDLPHMAGEPDVRGTVACAPPSGAQATAVLARTLTWGRHVLYIAAWLTIALMCALTWAPHVTRYKTDVIIGPSMEPSIPLWSVIVVEPVEPEAIRAGDVITFQRPDQPSMKVTHRVARVLHTASGPAFITKGDNNAVRDPWRVDYVDTGYRVAAHVPYVGWAMTRAQGRIARVLLVAVPTLVLLLQFLIWLWRPEDDEEEEAEGLDDPIATADDRWPRQYDEEQVA